MQESSFEIWPPIIGVAAGLVAVVVGYVLASRRFAAARSEAESILAEARREADNARKEILVAAQEKAVGLEEEVDRREREIEEREAGVDARDSKLQQERKEQRRQAKDIERRQSRVEAGEQSLTEREAALVEHEERARVILEQTAGLTRDQARTEVIREIEVEARAEGARIARKIEDEARQNAEREARNVILQASQRVNLRDVMESTVSFIELPNDEMKGRIIGKEGRNIRALEMATGIDLIVDDTPRSIWISSFDPVRREIARVAIDRLLEDGRIHPARIEEAVQQVAGEIESRIDQQGHDAAFTLGITDLNPRLAHLVGRMRYHTSHGQNLMQHAIETAMIGGYMAQEIGGNVETVQRAGLLHEIGHVSRDNGTSHPLHHAAELCGRHSEDDQVAQSIRSLHPDVQPTTIEALLLNIANRLSESRPGARKENLAVFIERLRRLETIAKRFDGVRQAFAIKSGKELRVILDADTTRDDQAFELSKAIARAVEKELSYPGQIKVSVVRETRAVRFAV